MTTEKINQITRPIGLVLCLILLVSLRHFTEWSWLLRAGVAVGATIAAMLVLVFILGCFSTEENTPEARETTS